MNKVDDATLTTRTLTLLGYGSRYTTVVKEDGQIRSQVEGCKVDSGSIDEHC